MKSFDFKELLTSKSILTVKTTKSCIMISCILYVPDNVLLHFVKGGGGGCLTLYEIYIGFCPRTDFYNIMHIACLVHGHFISNIDFLLTT